MNYRNMPGPGDEATWGPYEGHPNDPRAPLEDDLDLAVAEAPRTAMTLDQAKAEVEALLCKLWKCPDDHEVTIHLWWDGVLTEAPPCVGVRVAEISMHAKTGMSGASLMACVPEALGEIAAVERCIIERMVCTCEEDEWDNEIKDADWRLAELCKAEAA